MLKYSRVIVIGTTADYIEWIRTACHDRVVFVTAPEVRLKAEEPVPEAIEEILCDLTDEEAVFCALSMHLDFYGLLPVGIACFDCESMALAAAVAERLGLSYPSADAIEICRNKYLSKALWQQNDVECPVSHPVRFAEDVSVFFEKIPGPCVLKPLSGSGSELVYVCDSVQTCELNFRIVREELGRREKNRLYSSGDEGGPLMIVEEYVEGEEYSCDFLLDDGRIDIIRITRKIKALGRPVGTIRGYVFPADLPKCLVDIVLPGTLKTGARALGLTRCICMADFILRKERIVLLEMTPRPGGDCLPFLLRKASGLDMLALTVDFAEGKPVCPPNVSTADLYIGMRVHAGKAGVLKSLEATAALEDSRVLEAHFPRSPGHMIVFPPADYDSWLLGHVIFRPKTGVDLESECRTICEKIKVEIDA
jgi:biotin carboxylase